MPNEIQINYVELVRRLPHLNLPSDGVQEYFARHAEDPFSQIARAEYVILKRWSDTRAFPVFEVDGTGRGFHPR